MSTEYRHGAYGIMGTSIVSGTDTAMTAPLIIGTAPVNLVRGYAEKGIINTPIRLANAGAKDTIGYSKDWENFTLCETVKAFFENEKGNIGPVYVINVLNPDIHKEEEVKTQMITFINGRSTLESDRIILDTFAIDDKTEGMDYEISYNFITGKLVITSKDPQNKLSGNIAVSYQEVNPAMITEEDIIGKITEEGIYTGLQAGELLYPQLNVIPNLLAAPGWTEKPAVYEAVTEFAKQINGHWSAFVYADIPIKYKEENMDTKEKAMKWAMEHAYNSMLSKTFFPKAKTANGEIYHLSTLALVETLRTDRKHGGIPMETCSNKSIPVATQYFGQESKNQGYDQKQANELNAAGITTMIAWGGECVLWGPHTAAFQAAENGNIKKDIDPVAGFDTNVRMQQYILNHFQETWGNTIDTPLDENLKDTILEREQQFLDGLTSMGALIGEPVAEFLETENTRELLMNGNFKWNLANTPTPPAKSLTAETAYTDSGFSSYFGEEE